MIRRAFLAGLVALTATISFADSFWQPLTWTTTDGVNLSGLYHPASRSGAYTWVLLHGLGSTKGEWNDFARQLAGQGSGILIYDARGHGESNRTSGGLPLDYRQWRRAGPETPWDAMPTDLGSALRKLQDQFNLSTKTLAVGGASLGANVALVYAAHHPGVPAVVLLSPGMAYAGISAGPAYETYRGRPIFMAASPGDTYAYSSVRELTDLTPDPARTIVEGKEGHGVKMLDEKFTRKLLAWMKNVEK